MSAAIGYGWRVVTIPAQFNGPDGSGNGGWVCGLVAAQLPADNPDPIEVKLSAPPPLDVPLQWRTTADTIALFDSSETTIASATRGAFAASPPAAPSVEQAHTGMEKYEGHVAHPFSRCFTCGPQREVGDGLRIFSGQYEPGSTAALWNPHRAFADDDGHINSNVVWAALDCPGGWAADVGASPAVLGTMTARVIRRPEAGEPCVTRGVLMSQQGRKCVTATALYTHEHELLGHAEQVWIRIDPNQFLQDPST